MNILVESICDFLWLSERIATARQPTIAQDPVIIRSGRVFAVTEVRSK